MQAIIAAPPAVVLGVNELAQLLLGQYAPTPDRSFHNDLATAFTHVIAYPGYVIARMRYVNGHMSRYVPAWLRQAAGGHVRESYFLIRYHLLDGFPWYSGQVVTVLRPEEFRHFKRPVYPDIGTALLNLSTARR